MVWDKPSTLIQDPLKVHLIIQSIAKLLPTEQHLIGIPSIRCSIRISSKHRLPPRAVACSFTPHAIDPSPPHRAHRPSAAPQSSSTSTWKASPNLLTFCSNMPSNAAPLSSTPPRTSSGGPGWPRSGILGGTTGSSRPSCRTLSGSLSPRNASARRFWCAEPTAATTMPRISRAWRTASPSRAQSSRKGWRKESRNSKNRNKRHLNNHRSSNRSSSKQRITNRELAMMVTNLIDPSPSLTAA